MTKLTFKLFAAISIAVVGTSASASVDWNWSFQEHAINLATHDAAWVTVTNNATSADEIYVGSISPFSFGYLGLLYEDDFRRIITPTFISARHALLPGESISFIAIQFFLNPVDLPTPGVTYQILPTMSVIAGLSCDGDVSLPGCVGLSRPAESMFTLGYAPVPELPSYILMILGLATYVSSKKATHMLAPQSHHYQAQNTDA